MLTWETHLVFSFPFFLPVPFFGAADIWDTKVLRVKVTATSLSWVSLMSTSSFLMPGRSTMTWQASSVMRSSEYGSSRKPSGCWDGAAP